MNKIDLKGEVAIVTGGASGIGLAVAKRLTASGAKVCLWDIDQDMLKAAKAEVGTRCYTYRVDITRLAQVERTMARVAERFGKLSILVNSAGIAGPNARVADYPVKDWQAIMDINLNGPFYVNRSAVPFMEREGYGRIVNIASVAGKEGNPNASAYSASKAAVIAFTKSLGKELAGYDISVNCITPAAARTAIFDQMSEEHIGYMLQKIPRGRFVKVEEVAALAAFCASADCAFTTGAVFDISGGRATY